MGVAPRPVKAGDGRRKGMQKSRGGPADTVAGRLPSPWVKCRKPVGSGRLPPPGAAAGRRPPQPGWETATRMLALANLINTIVTIYIWLLIASAVLSWLVAFNVINTSNRFVYTLGDFLYRVTEPALRPIRRLLPNLGGIDISPIVLILLLYFLRDLVVNDLLLG